MRMWDVTDKSVVFSLLP